nr:Putative phosphoethanolamine transferase ybiP [Klebsiella pneumoniae]
MDGILLLQSLLINPALGYEFSLLYTVAFTCVLHLLWRAFPRVQKAVVGAYSLLAALYYPFGRPTVPLTSTLCWRCTPPTWKSLRKS